MPDRLVSRYNATRTGTRIISQKGKRKIRTTTGQKSGEREDVEERARKNEDRRKARGGRRKG